MRRQHKTKHLGFLGLEHKVEREYERKGYSKKTSKLYGQETAAKVYRLQKRKGYRG